MIKTFILFVLFSFTTSLSTSAQPVDSLNQNPQDNSNLKVKTTYSGINSIRPRLGKQMIIPALLTTYGFVALENDRLIALDNKIKEEVWSEHPHQPNHFDDWLQYMPGFSVYVLNGLGYRGKNNLLDATRQYLISSFLMAIVVQSTKNITKLRRPDGFGSNAFPSGHTAVGFVAAEFLNQEYKDRSILIPVLGYTAAATVGYMRIYNNKHWFKDVISGAGIGIGITKLVYWVYPAIKRKFFKDKPVNTMIMPYYQNGSGGLSFIHHFHY